jgi:hypothetical protein
VSSTERRRSRTYSAVGCTTWPVLKTGWATGPGRSGYDSSCRFNEVVRRGLAIIAAAIAGLLSVAAARADGDPASDMLPVQNTSTPFPPPAGAQALAASVEKVFESGHRVKVAVIATRRDLGSIPSLFGKANAYAHFLGTELGAFYAGPLLIVMPSGFGIYDGRRSTAPEAAVLAKLKVNGSSASALIGSATTAVDALASAGALNSPDILPPNSYPQQSTVSAGKPARLIFHILEDSEHSSAVVTIYAGTKVLGVLHAPMQFADYNTPRFVTWSVPNNVPRKGLKYCVVATDSSGNRQQPPACGPITVVH